MFQRHQRSGHQTANRHPHSSTSSRRACTPQIRSDIRSHICAHLRPRALPLALAGILGVLAVPSAVAQITIGSIVRFKADQAPMTNLDPNGMLITPLGGIFHHIAARTQGSYVNSVDVGVIENRGQIENSNINSNEYSNALYSSGGIRSLINAPDASITGNSTGVYLDHGGVIINFTNGGLIKGRNVAAILNQGQMQQLTNTSDGHILGATQRGVFNEGTINAIDNAGSLDGGLKGILNSGHIGVITNSGIISGTHAIDTTMNGTIGPVNNSGSIKGKIRNLGRSRMTINGASGIGFGPTFGTVSGLFDSIGTIETPNNGLMFEHGNLVINAHMIARGHTVTNNGATLRVDNHITISGDFTQMTGALEFGVADLANPTGAVNDQGIGRLFIEGNSAFAPGTRIGLVRRNKFGFARGQRYWIIATKGDAIYNQNKLIYSVPGYDGVVVANVVTQDGQKCLVLTLGSLKDDKAAAAKGEPSANADAAAKTDSKTDPKTDPKTDSTLEAKAKKKDDASDNTDAATNAININNIDLTPVNRATTGNANAALTGLLNYKGAHQPLVDIVNAAAASGTSDVANQLGRQLNPSAVTGSAAHASAAASTTAYNIAGTRLTRLRIAAVSGDRGGSGGMDSSDDSGDGTGYSGIATGERRNRSALWVQVFGGRAGQHQQNNISGYHASYKGVVLGADTLVTPRWRTGLMFSHARTAVNTDDANLGSSASVGNYGLAGYASYDGKPWFLNLMAGVAHQRNDTNRAITAGGLSESVQGSFNSRLYSSSLQVGYPMRLASGSTVTPLAGLLYSTLRQSSYTESGDSAAALAVGASGSHSLKSDLGVKFDHTARLDYGALTTSLQLRWRHAFNDARMTTTSSFVADASGTTSFTTMGSAAPRDSAALTLGIALARKKNMTLSFNYTVEAASGYKANTADVKVRWRY